MTSTDRNWMRLDNAATIYPASRSRNWMALFRISAQLKEPVDPAILQQALERTVRRFPMFAQRLRRGLFWNYLEQLEGAPQVQKDVRNPCVPMDFAEMGGFMFRVRYHERRIAVEFFHALTDGTGGLCFTKTLVAEYLELHDHIRIPRQRDILDCNVPPRPEEFEDSFQRFARGIARSRRESAAFCIPGTPTDQFMYITTGVLDAEAVRSKAKAYNATVTEYLTAQLILAIDRLQLRCEPNRRRHKPVKICVPLNLRKYYPTETLRNFASYMNPGIEPRFGQYDLEETIRQVRGLIMLESDEKLLNAKFSTNVLSASNPVLRIAPLFLKNRAMKLVFRFKGDRQTSSCLSNLGATWLPEEMAARVERMDFLLGPLSRNRVAMAALSSNGKLVLNFTRTIRESEVERAFFTALVKAGLHVCVESNLGG